MSEQKVHNFMGYSNIALGISILLIVISIGSLAVRGINFGLDFTGGTLVEVGYDSPANLSNIRASLTAAGFENAVVQHFGTETDVMIRIQTGSSNKLGAEIVALLQADGQKVDLRRIEFVGPQVGDELKEQGSIAMLLALVVVMIYVAMRFQMKFSVGAVAALAHDVIITLGFFSVFQWEFDLTVLAAILAIIGYSINDTIVVFDRIRENFRLLRKGDSVEIVNISLTQTLGRTLATSFTTLIVVVVLLLAGGELIHDFALALTIGIVIGTYSSIYIASKITLLMHLSKEDLLIPEKEGEEFDLP